MNVRRLVIQAYFRGLTGEPISDLLANLANTTHDNIEPEVASLKREVAALRREVEASRPHNVVAMRSKDADRAAGT